jgi:hypothetical protein
LKQSEEDDDGQVREERDRHRAVGDRPVALVFVPPPEIDRPSDGHHERETDDDREKPSATTAATCGNTA